MRNSGKLKYVAGTWGFEWQGGDFSLGFQFRIEICFQFRIDFSLELKCVAGTWGFEWQGGDFSLGFTN